MKYLKHILLLFILFTLTQCKSHQSGQVNNPKIVKGNVNDPDDSPIPGANIIVKRTKKRVYSGFDGEFEVEVIKGDVLIVSYIGMQTKEITIDSNNYYKVVTPYMQHVSRKTERFYRRYAREHNGAIPEF